MRYRIVITVTEPNPDYEQQMAEYRKAERYNSNWANNMQLPSAYREVKTLDTVLSDEEFRAARDSILQAMAPPKLQIVPTDLQQHPGLSGFKTEY